jgi:hypothetical protein
MPRRGVPSRDPEGRRRRLATFTLFIVAVLYGLAIVAAISNTVVFFARLALGEQATGNLSIALLGWAIILYAHHKLRWPPFGWPFPRR